MDADVGHYLQFYGGLVAIVRPLIVLALLAGLWSALRRAGLSPRPHGSRSLLRL